MLHWIRDNVAPWAVLAFFFVGYLVFSFLIEETVFGWIFLGLLVGGFVIWARSVLHGSQERANGRGRSQIARHPDPYSPEVRNAVDIRDLVPVEPGVHQDPKDPNVYYFDNEAVMRDFQARHKTVRDH